MDQYLDFPVREPKDFPDIKRRLIAAMPIHGAYAEFVCLPQRELVPVPSGLDAAEAVSLILNYITAYQMLHHSAQVRPGQRVLIHGASGGVGTALLQLGRLAGLEMYGTCSARGASAVSELGGIGVRRACLSGGEIFVRPDLFTLIDGIIENKMRYSILTNGTLITPEIADYLADWRPFSIEVTIYGRTRETYEGVTGVPRVLRTAVSAASGSSWSGVSPWP
jgi:hypothetical protein